MTAAVTMTVVPRCRKGSDLLFAVHFTPNSSYFETWSRIAFPKTVTLEFFSKQDIRPNAVDATFLDDRPPLGAPDLWKRVLEAPADTPPLGVRTNSEPLTSITSFGEYESHQELEVLRVAPLRKLGVSAGVDPSSVKSSSRRHTAGRLQAIRRTGPAATAQQNSQTLTREEVLSALTCSGTMQRKLGLVIDVVAKDPSWLSDAFTRVRLGHQWAADFATLNGLPPADLLRLATEVRFDRVYGCRAVCFDDKTRSRAWKRARGDSPALDEQLANWQPDPDDPVAALKGYATCTADPVRGTMNTLQGRQPKEVGRPHVVDQTIGILALKSGSDAFLSYSLARHSDLNKQAANPRQVLDPELDGRVDLMDLTRGFRPYVRVGADKPGPWSSLCWSRVFLEGVDYGEENGCVDHGVVKEPNSDRGISTDVLFAWRNWPLCVPQFFDSLSPDATTSPSPGAVLSRGLSKDHRIPPMRLTYTYEFLLAPVSITGDLLGTEPPDSLPVRNEHRCRLTREDPVGPPDVLHPRQRHLSTEARRTAARRPSARTTLPGLRADARSSDKAVRSHEIVVTDDGPDEEHARWLMAPIVGAELFELAGGLDRDDRQGFSPEALSLLHASDRLSHVAGDALVERLGDPASDGVLIEMLGEKDSCLHAPVPVQFGYVRPDQRAAFLVATTDRHRGWKYGSKDGRPSVSVYVPKGEELRIRLRSLIAHGALNGFALNDRLRFMLRGAELDPRPAMLSALQPAIEISILRPVRTPVDSPSLVGVRVSGRHLGDLGATFEVSPRLHRGSTERVELLGRWSEYSDGPTHLERHDHEELLDVLEMPVELWDGKRASDAVPCTLPRNFRYAFADGRYRKLQLRLRASAPERHIRALGLAQGDARDSNPLAVEVLNTVPPKALEVVEIQLITHSTNVPGPAITDDRRDQRWGVRLFFGPGFMLSGPGELVALLSGLEGTVDGRPPASRLVTTFGADLMGGPVATDARLPAFAPAVSTDGAQHTVPLAAEGGKPALITCFQPQRLDDRWYVDVRIDSNDLYYPFARLVLARYQPNSVAGAELSPPTELEFLQVPPARTIFKFASDFTVRFAISGVFRQDTEVQASLYVKISETIDYAKNPDRGDLMLDESGLWMPYLERGLPLTASMKYDPSCRCMVGEITLPMDANTMYWRILVEESEKYIDVAGYLVKRVVWYASYDSENGFSRGE